MDRPADMFTTLQNPKKSKHSSNLVTRPEVSEGDPQERQKC